MENYECLPIDCDENVQLTADPAQIYDIAIQSVDTGAVNAIYISPTILTSNLNCPFTTITILDNTDL